MTLATCIAIAVFAAQAAVPPPTDTGAAPDASAPASHKDVSQPARTRGELKWVREILAGYPSKAKRDMLEGSVDVSVVVSPEGRASACKVTRSSGHSILDEAACNGMLKHSRFTPARDASGAPTTGSFSTRISYFNQ